MKTINGDEFVKYNKTLSDFFSKLLINIQDPNKIKMRIVMSIILIVLSLFLYHLLKKWSYSQNKNIKKRHLVFMFSKYLILFISIFLLFITWIRVIDSILLTFFIVIAIMFFSIKGGVSNILGWFMILNKHYFKIYDQIQINGTKGIVLEIHPFYFVVMEVANWFEEDETTGRTVKIPNNMILNHRVFNYNSINPFIWKEIHFSLTFDSNWEKAEQIMNTVAKDYLYEFNIKYLSDPDFKDKILTQLQLYNGKLLPQQVINITDEAIVLKVRFIVYYNKGSKVTTKLNRNILKAFSKENDIEISGKRIYMINNKPSQNSN